MKIDGAKLRAARKAAGKSVQEATQISGLSDSSISRYENKGGDMNMHIVRALAKAYNVAAKSLEVQ